MAAPLSRREFLKLSVCAGWAVVLPQTGPELPPEDQTWRYPVGKGRVGTRVIGLYSQPSFHSNRLTWRRRDELIDLFEEITSENGPAYNPRWYRVAGGYIHSGYVQRVERAHLNPVLSAVSVEGRLGEVTVPYTQSFRLSRGKDYYPLYRLYFESVHWITRLIEGPDGEPWYGLTDDRLRVIYYIPAAHIRPIQAGELSAISPHVPQGEKSIGGACSEALVGA